MSETERTKVPFKYSLKDSAKARITELELELQSLKRSNTVNEENSPWLDFAKRELYGVGYSPEDEDGDINKMMYDDIMELLTVFSKQGHSGFSAPYAISLFSKLANYKALSPLTGEDDEWNDIGNETLQNRRCSAVFKDANRFDGRPYYIDAIVWREACGCGFTGSNVAGFSSFQPITFPFTPKTFYIDVEEDKNNPEECVVKNLEDFREFTEYYNLDFDEFIASGKCVVNL